MKLFHVNKQRVYEIPYANINLGAVRMFDYDKESGRLAVAFTSHAASEQYQKYLDGLLPLVKIDWYGIQIDIIGS